MRLASIGREINAAVTSILVVALFVLYPPRKLVIMPLSKAREIRTDNNPSNCTRRHSDYCDSEAKEQRFPGISETFYK